MAPMVTLSYGEAIDGNIANVIYFMKYLFTKMLVTEGKYLHPVITRKTEVSFTYDCMRRHQKQDY